MEPYAVIGYIAIGVSLGFAAGFIVGQMFEDARREYENEHRIVISAPMSSHIEQILRETVRASGHTAGTPQEERK